MVMKFTTSYARHRRASFVIGTIVLHCRSAERGAFGLGDYRIFLWLRLLRKAYHRLTHTPGSRRATRYAVPVAKRIKPENFCYGVNKTMLSIVLYIQNSRKRNRISFFIGLDFKVFSKRGSRETAALVLYYAQNALCARFVLIIYI